MTDNKKPIAKIRDGNLTASIWSNPKQDGEGVRYAITYTRSYKTEDGWRENATFNPLESLRLTRLITKALDRIDELKSVTSEEGGQ